MLACLSVTLVTAIIVNYIIEKPVDIYRASLKN